MQVASFTVQLAIPFPTPPLGLAPVLLCNGCCSGTKIVLDKGIQNSRTLTARKLALKEHLEPFQTYKIAFILVTRCKESYSVIARTLRAPQFTDWTRCCWSALVFVSSARSPLSEDAQSRFGSQPNLPAADQ